tara:strand:+ start:134 stop:301 length:168 start_codon:yes stop_codon:yes gene_type:complete
MLVVAFFLGFYAHQILKGCNVIEGKMEYDSPNEEREQRAADDAELMALIHAQGYE